MRPLGLGEHGDVGYSLEGGSTVAVIYYRDFSGRRRRVKRLGSPRRMPVGRCCGPFRTSLLHPWTVSSRREVAWLTVRRCG